ncbi:hypothetical protein JRO89_XS03G0041900 [Xanthoceras sorbifolium]|uniref:Glycosyltransferase n=1 Tax=Xanthoceras sorbifolium TaxID=99658 RepID=A0ABQ8I8J9_9ROSI|nr:hypothetical protein JRO89_XS03G0041900 [Xanthoceras sorbifolium]
MKNLHFLLLTCSAQGHINPTLQLAKRLLCGGAQVTFATTVRGLSKIKNLPSLDGLFYASFSDGFDNGTKPDDDFHHIMSEFKRVGSQALAHLIQTLSNEGRRVDFLVYGLLLPWAAEVARDMYIPSALLCSQSASAFAIFHHFFNSHQGIYSVNDNNIPPCFVNLPGLPSLAQEDLPSFLLPSSPHAAVISTFKEHFQNLEKDSNPCVLLNTFDALEEEAIRNVGDHINIISIGPLIPSDNKPLGCDLFEASIEYIQWLDSKPDRSVVYVSFGSLAVLQRKQMEEVLHGLVSTGIPFLWVIRSSEEDQFEEIISKVDEDKQGLIVPWCSQVEVLSHQSVGCFVTHCGWNSTLESLVAGVPVVSCPQFSDQMMNAKMVEEIWGTGIRGRVVNDIEEGIVKREEIKRCVEIVMGSGEITKNCKKWRELALEAVGGDGSSDINFRAFMENLRA